MSLRSEWTDHQVNNTADGMVLQYEGDCEECGRMRQFEFLAADENPPPPPAFGNETPSQIIDPGQFLLLSQRAADAAPANPADLTPADHADGWEAIRTAVAALREVLKFIPSGGDAVPEALLISEPARILHDDDPDQFSRARLEVVLAAYERMQADYGR